MNSPHNLASFAPLDSRGRLPQRVRVGDSASDDDFLELLVCRAGFVFGCLQANGVLLALANFENA
jgi:hypothetical protein